MEVPLIIVGLGANLPHPRFGAPRNTLEAAVTALERRGLQVLARSSWYDSPPWPPSLGHQPWYVNGIISVATSAAPDRLLRLLHEVEWAFGRVRAGRWTPRCLDLDLIAYDDRITQGTGRHGSAVLPHPRVAERAFVLAPLSEIAPDWRHPATGATVGEMLRAVDRSGVTPVGDDRKDIAPAGAVR